MSDIDYLNEIAKDNRLAKKGRNGKGFSFDMNVVKVLVGAVVAVIFVVIIGSILGGSGDKERNAMDRLHARATNIIKIVEEYNEKVKSSNLRSMAKSLQSVMVETKTNVDILLGSEYGSEDADEPKDETITTEETEHFVELDYTIKDGWLNGYIDRHYVRELEKEIVLLISLESEILERTNKEPVTVALSKSRSNLNNLLKQFQDHQAD